MFSKLLVWLSGFGHSLWQFLEPIVISETGALLNQVLPIALNVVTGIEQTGKLPSAEKQAAAYAQLEAAVKTAGINAGTSVLNTAIELAVQHLKATTPATPATPAA